VKFIRGHFIRNNSRFAAHRGQGLVEFALVLPALLLVVVSIIDFGRLMITISSVASATRDAARYGASVGANASGTAHYQDCTGIRETVHQKSLFLELDILIEYDADGPGANASIEYCSSGVPVDPAFQATLGSQIIVKASAPYNSFFLTGILKMPSIPVSSEARRTILRDIFID
jgi:hypothetical protein